MAKLAIHGGEPVIRNKNIGRDNVDKKSQWPIITDKDKNAVMETLDSGIILGAFAPKVTALQKAWAEYVGTKHCIATNSGTAALHIAVKGAGILAGDEVIVPALTFVASAFAPLHANAIPVFVDIDPNTYNIDTRKIEAKITEKTKAILPVHLHGLPADMDEINVIAKKYNLAVIEDACQAHGALYKGKKTGSLGDIAAFSLNGAKNLPGGEGGLLNTSNDEFFYRARIIRDLGENIQEGLERYYDAEDIGWMYRYTEMNASLVLSKLKSLDEENNIRIKNAEFLTENLSKFKGVKVPFVPSDRTSVYHLYRIRINPKELGIDISPNDFRAKVQKALRAEGLQANRWQNKPIPMQKVFQNMIGYGYGCPWTCQYGSGNKIKYNEEDFIETRKLTEDSFILHNAIYPPNGIKEVSLYVEAFDKLWNNLDEVLEVKILPDEIYTMS